MDKRKNLITMGGEPMTLVGKEIKVGDKAPDFTALKTDLTPYSLKDAEDKIKIISVVPSLDTGVCELQTIRFNEMASELGDIVILTISVDLPFAQSRFCGAKGIDKVITLSDHRDLDFGMKYGFVLEELRLLSRGIVILDRDNTVKHVEYVKEVTNHPDYDKALEEVKKLL
ncbi:MAG: thiol peroxidase [Tissierellaceae bacterium]